MSEPTDFKNREYRMVRVDRRQVMQCRLVDEDIEEGGWEVEFRAHSEPNDPILIVAYSRPRRTSDG